jgi:hypothetical protein
VYDTQCGAKLFLNNEVLKLVFSHPFTSYWIFDVEILARMKVIHEYFELPDLVDCAVEYPLRKWQHASGSNVTPLDFFCSARDLFRIWLFLIFPALLPQNAAIHNQYKRAAKKINTN